MYSDLNIYSGFERDGGNLLDDGGRADEVDKSLVDAHLISVEGVGSLSARRFAGGDDQNLGGETSRSTDLQSLQLLLLGSSDELAANWKIVRPMCYPICLSYPSPKPSGCGW